MFASFPCTRNRNRIPNTVPESPNEYGSDRFRFRLCNSVANHFGSGSIALDVSTHEIAAEMWPNSLVKGQWIYFGLVIEQMGGVGGVAANVGM